MSVQKVSQVCWLLLVLVAVPSIAGAAKTAPSALPPEARAVLDEGIIVSGITMQDQTMKGFVQAITQIADRLIDVRRLGR